MSDEEMLPVEIDNEPPDVIEVEVVDDDAPASVVADEVGESAPDPVSNHEAQSAKAAELQKEIDHLREMYLRKLAEFDNYRKRTEREKEEREKTAGEAVVLDLIPVLDNFERALEHASEAEPKVFRQGVEMIAKQLLAVLGRRGLEQFDPQGEVFEPQFHDAVQRVTDPDHAPGTVAWVLAKGYKLGGRVVRPAMVGVSMEAPDPGLSTAADVSADEGDAS